MKPREDLHAVLLALPGDTLLLPNVAVAEVVSPERLQPAKSGPDWLAGTISYNERQLRLVRFEVMNGGVKSDATRRTRIAIIQSYTGRLRAGHYGLLCLGHPNLVTLNREALRPEPRHATDRDELTLARVRIANTSALIPNLEQLELELARIEERESKAAASAV